MAHRLSPSTAGRRGSSCPTLLLEEREVGARELRLMDRDEAGLWESLGYHNYGESWRQQRYDGDR